MTNRQLRRPRRILDISRRIETSPSYSAPRSTLTTHYEHLLDQLEQEFFQVHEALTGIFSGRGARIIPMTDADHYRRFTAFLNPSLAERFNYNELGAVFREQFAEHDEQAAISNMARAALGPIRVSEALPSTNISRTSAR